MIDDYESLNNIDESQGKFAEANQTGYELGLEGGRYVSPYDAIPEICADRESRTDRFAAYHYDKGYLTAYGVYLKHTPDAIEDIMYKKLAKQYRLIDEALKLGSSAYIAGKSRSQEVEDVFYLLAKTPSYDHLGIYDAWELGYLLAEAYDDQSTKKIRGPRFDYERAYALVHAAEEVRAIAAEAGCEDNPFKLNIEEIAHEDMTRNGIAAESDQEMQGTAVRAYLNSLDILNASEDIKLIECLTCPYHYGVRSGDRCDGNCHESAEAIHMMIGVEDDVFRKWLVRTAGS